MATPEQRGALVHKGRGFKAAVVHQYPDSPWNDEVEYRFSLRHMAGFLYRKITGQQQGEVKLPQTRGSEQKGMVQVTE